MVEEDKIMGLDCYIVHANDHDKAFTHKDDERIKDVSLCGGMLSGGGSDGSFRGKVYEPLIDDLMQHDGGIWHKTEDDNPPYVTSDELKEQAEALEEFLHTVREEYGVSGSDPNDTNCPLDIDDDTIVYQAKDWAEYTLSEVKDLATLLRVASERKAVMHVWW
jgi:hypothetical protein